MNQKSLDPGLASILDSIRASMSGDPAENAAPAAPAAPGAEAARPASTPPAPVPPVRSVEDFLADLARPHVKAWVDANLPEIVQKLAEEEVKRLTGG